MKDKFLIVKLVTSNKKVEKEAVVREDEIVVITPNNFMDEDEQTIREATAVELSTQTTMLVIEPSYDELKKILLKKK